MTENIDNTNYINRDIEKEMKKSYLDYSMSVIVSRALPDVRDGLKPVHRRILFGMSQLGLSPDKPHRKSARLVGDVMGRFHPHGDGAIYDAVVRLAQDFNTRYPLADGQGNFGSIDGDSAAAMRYTEVRMTRLALEMLRDINKNVVDFQPNFDEEEEEPKVLPSRFPNLLVNGSSGIAVGMSTNMAPHNLREVIDGCIAYIDNHDISTEELMEYIKGPDFPTGAQIMGKTGFLNAYKTGRGKVKMRGVASIEPYKTRNRIIITEIPYQVNKARLITKIVELVRDEKLEGISDIRDDSDMSGIRIVIDLRRDANPNVVLNNLYKNTQLESTFGIINLCLVNGEPKELGLKDLIKYYIEHQYEVLTRRTQFDLDKAEARAHVVEGLLIAIDNIDEIIKIIRSNYDNDTIKAEFTKRFGLTDIQGQAILDMRLKRLSGLEKEKLEAEYKELEEKIKYYKGLLEDKLKMNELLKSELSEIKEKYGDERRTKIMPDEGELDLEDLYTREEILVTLTKQGYIKRTPLSQYKVQNRGGKGIKGLTTKEDDYVEHLFITTTHDKVSFFTNYGKVYSLNSYEIMEGRRQSQGQAIVNLLPLAKDEKVKAVFPVKNINENSVVVFATKNGIVKKTKASEYANIRKNGIIAINLRENDQLISARLTDDDEDLMLITKSGMSIRFDIKTISETARNSIGVKGISLNEGDSVISMNLTIDGNYLLVCSENGYGKKTLLTHYGVQNRGGKGLKTYKENKKTGKLVDSKIVDAEDEIMLVSVNNDIIRLTVKNISTLGRSTQGVRLKNVKSDDEKIVAVAKYIEKIEDDIEEKE